MRPRVTERPEAASDGTGAAATAPDPEVIARLGEATRRLRETLQTTERLAAARAAMLQSMDTSLTGRPDLRFNGRSAPLSLNEVARRTGRHPEVLRRWCANGTLPAVRVGRTWAIAPETLALLLANGTRSRPRLGARRSD